MRWDGQAITADDGALPGLGRMAGLVRTVRTPEFAGVTFHEVLAKSALSKVPGESRMPFTWTINPYRGCSHACSYCLGPDTLILRGDGRQVPLRDIRAGDQVVGTEVRGRYRRYVLTTVEDVWATRKRAFTITLEDGTRLTASGDHRFLTDRGWKHVAPGECGAGQRPYLTTNNKLMGFGTGDLEKHPASRDDAAYRRGYLTGMIRGDGMLLRRTYRRRDGNLNNVSMFRLALADREALDRSRDFLEQAGITTTMRPFSPGSTTRRSIMAIFTSRSAHFDAIQALISWPPEVEREWAIGYLAGIFDAEGGCSRGVLRISNKDEEILGRISDALTVIEVPFVREPSRENGVSTIRIVGGLAARMRFFRIVDPAISRKLAVTGLAVKSGAPLEVRSVEDIGEERDLLDLTTGTGDFIANGVISHNCFARPSHRYLDMNPGEDFDSQIVVKMNVAEVLRAELAKPSWTGDAVALGTNTDPYQRAEGRYRLMPGIIDALEASRTPFSILTKGTLLRRDLPRLTQAAEHVDVGIGVSLAFVDEDLQQAVEPGTPTPRARLDLARAARAAGLPCGVMIAPVLPWLTDSTDHLTRLLDAVHEAGATGATVLPLFLKPGTREWFMAWLRRDHPERVSGYERVYAGGSYASRAYRDWLWDRVRPLLVERGFASAGHRAQARTSGHARTAWHPETPGERARHDEGAYPAGSLVTQHRVSARPSGRAGTSASASAEQLLF
ncbi:intein-containing Rv2578c family radical SAM protein [Oerskovia gallyi]|uniref:Intein-containing Rv2578c family radical SAM protein n=1 Tax=Oerskovia gallyi TaxID=2762226 RepID=A0ABR8V3B9_9CELL|nr:intein-containing Rv2578c family radical SAM protein [Oerskovia gallyi]MBD7998791.1 intein-containing Rv2578c family radical SAM protein [Oerskovia gallyi]